MASILSAKQINARLRKGIISIDGLIRKLSDKITTMKELIDEVGKFEDGAFDIAVGIERIVGELIIDKPDGEPDDQFDRLRKYIFTIFDARAGKAIYDARQVNGKEVIEDTIEPEKTEESKPATKTAEEVPFAKMPLSSLLARCDKHFEKLEEITIRSDTGKLKFYERYNRVKLGLFELEFQPTGVGQLMGIINYMTDPLINGDLGKTAVNNERMDQDIFDEVTLCIYRDFREIPENNGRLTNTGMMDLHDFEILIKAKKKGIKERNRRRLYEALGIWQEEQTSTWTTDKGPFSMMQGEVDKLR